MQSSLLRLAPRLSRRPLAWLTLCAITAPSTLARAQSAPTHDITSLLDSATDDEAAGTPSGALDDAPLSATTPVAFTLGATAKEALASIALPRLMLASSAAPAEQGSTAAPTQAGADDDSGLRTAGYVAGGVGLVGIALFAIAGLGAKSAYDKLDSDCGKTACTDEAHRSDIEGGRMLQTTANIGLAVGLTGLGVGATLLVLGSRSSVERRGPSASVSANGGMITYGGHF
jgi:hypothetical protein